MNWACANTDCALPLRRSSVPYAQARSKGARAWITTTSQRTDPAATTKHQAAAARRGDTTHATRNQPTRTARNMGAELERV